MEVHSISTGTLNGHCVGEKEKEWKKVQIEAE